jgi:hypothetical protein
MTADYGRAEIVRTQIVVTAILDQSGDAISLFITECLEGARVVVITRCTVQCRVDTACVGLTGGNDAGIALVTIDSPSREAYRAQAIVSYRTGVSVVAIGPIRDRGNAASHRFVAGVDGALIVIFTAILLTGLTTAVLAMVASGAFVVVATEIVVVGHVCASTCKRVTGVAGA